MTANSKSMVLLAVTLVVGFTLGLFADARLVQRRNTHIEGLGRPQGFVDHMQTIIAPHGDAQRDSIRPILEQTFKRNGEIIKSANAGLKATMDSMRVQLSPMLDSSQRERLASEVTHMPQFGPGGRGGRGGRGRGGPGGRGGGGFDRGGPPPDRPPPD